MRKGVHMNNLLLSLLSNLEYRFWRMHEYLAYMRGDLIEAGDCSVRAADCLRTLDILSIQEEF